jgi:hypothetical protein
MRAFAAALGEYLSRQASEAPSIGRDAIRYEFAGVEQTALQHLEAQDRLYVDAGNRIDVGVIDHRVAGSGAASSTSVVLAHPELIDGTLKPWRRSDSPYVIVMHESPDLDSAAACFLAESYLLDRRFPAGSAALAAYVDSVTLGSAGFSPANRYSLYAAFMQLAHRAALRDWARRDEQWTQVLREAGQVIAYVLKTAAGGRLEIGAVDAFKTPGVLGVIDRRELDADYERYGQKLADPRHRAGRLRLRLPTLDGDRVEFDMLFARDVQNDDDPDRCILFKDWSRSDRDRCPESGGFLGLCVMSRQGDQGPCHCTISVRPDSRASLRALAVFLEEEECARRTQRFGIDDRIRNPNTGETRSPRPGYGNADPWYDGRSHHESIVASPRGGSLLSSEQIEAIIARFAAAGSQAAPTPLAGIPPDGAAG